MLANTVGALLAAVLTTLIVRRTHVPGFGLISAALLPLAPGLTLYHGLLQLVGTAPGTADAAAGGATLLRALGVAVGIGAGASLGTFLGAADLRSAAPHHVADPPPGSPPGP